MKAFFALCLLAPFIGAAAVEERPLFVMKKSHHPENILVVAAKVDGQCRFLPYKNGSYLDYYWLMDGKKRKRAHPLIKSGISKRVAFVKSLQGQSEFQARLNDLKELEHDLPDTSFIVKAEDVKAEEEKQECEIHALIKLGPSHKGRTLDLQQAYCQVDKNFLGVPRGCKSLTLAGQELQSGKKLSARFEKK